MDFIFYLHAKFYTTVVDYYYQTESSYFSRLSGFGFKFC